MGHHEEWHAVGRLGGHALGGVVGAVRGVHHAVLARVESLLPAPARPVTALQRGISGAVYHGIETAHRAAPSVGARVAARTWTDELTPPSQTRVGRVLLPAVHGIWGDTIATREPVLAVPMSVRVDARDLSIDPVSVAGAFPTATGRLAVFVHGLCESDESWWRTPATDTSSHPGSYGDRLHDEFGYTPVYLRFNTGLRVSDNGLALAGLLDSLTAAWPVPVQDITLIGHSMGGLVSRSACHQGDAAGMDWVAAVATVMTLGTPHLGAPLEKSVHVADRLMALLPETAPLARALRARSIGVKDLRYGAVVEDDWFGHDPDEFLRDRCTEIPFLDHAAYYWMAASITRDPDHPGARLLGDGLVRYPSAAGAGRSRRLPFEIGNGAHVTGVGHLALLNHPDVYAQIRAWLASPV